MLSTPHPSLSPAPLETLEPRLLFAFDPTNAEQLTLELINRFRADPSADLDRMVSSFSPSAVSDDPDIDRALAFFNVNGNELLRQFATTTPADPLAWNASLHDAAKRHNRLLRRNDSQSHQEPGEPGLVDRVQNEGYTNWSRLAENVYSFAEGIWHGHAGFVIDWGDSPTGIQDPPGHRITLLNNNFREVGISVLQDTKPETSVGPFLITQDFGNRSDLTDGILLGVIYDDRSGDVFYSLGEGMSGVTVTAVGQSGQGTFVTTSLSAGSYQLELPDGDYTVTYDGGTLNKPVVQNVTMTGRNVKLDVEQPELIPPLAAIVGGVGGRSADFGLLNVGETSQAVTFTVRNDGDLTLKLRNLRLEGVARGEYAFTLLDPDDNVTDPARINLETGEEAEVRVTLTPTRAGLRPAQIVFANNDGSSWSGTRIALTGEADAAGNNYAQARDLGVPTPGTTIRLIDHISSRDRSDVYRFELSTASEVRLVLDPLLADADLSLIDAEGNTLARPKLRGTAKELITQTLDPGVYFARILRGRGTTETRYSLRLLAETVTLPPTLAPGLPVVFTLQDEDEG